MKLAILALLASTAVACTVNTSENDELVVIEKTGTVTSAPTGSESFSVGATVGVGMKDGKFFCVSGPNKLMECHLSGSDRSDPNLPSCGELCVSVSATAK